jgi:hypothetical protein
VNITGPEQAATKDVALAVGEHLGREVHFIHGAEDPNRSESAGIAYLSDSGYARSFLGNPSVSMDTMVRWTARWLKDGGRSLGKPTHFEVSDGKF